jgi:hypothetical protein
MSIKYVPQGIPIVSSSIAFSASYALSAAHFSDTASLAGHGLNLIGPVGIQYTSSTAESNFSSSLEEGLTFLVGNSGASAYMFATSSFGLFPMGNNPTLNLNRNKTYYFVVNALGHPFWIKTVPTTGTGNAYNTGVTNNGEESGLIIFAVASDAPNTLYYICQNHSSMQGVINITG